MAACHPARLSTGCRVWTRQRRHRPIASSGVERGRALLTISCKYERANHCQCTPSMPTISPVYQLPSRRLCTDKASNRRVKNTLLAGRHGRRSCGGGLCRGPSSADVARVPWCRPSALHAHLRDQDAGQQTPRLRSSRNPSPHTMRIFWTCSTHRRSDKPHQRQRKRHGRRGFSS